MRRPRDQSPKEEHEPKREAAEVSGSEKQAKRPELGVGSSGRTETTINQNGSLNLDAIPFTEGDKVEVIILRQTEGMKILKKKRTTGEYVGKIRMTEDFSAPLPDEFWLGK